MELFTDVESYNIKTVVDDSRAWVKQNTPLEKGEDKISYCERIFWLVNDEIERRILISGKKRPDYSGQNLKIRGR